MKPDLECRVVNEQLKLKQRHDAHARKFEIGDTVFAKEFWARRQLGPCHSVTARTGPVSYYIGRG